MDASKLLNVISDLSFEHNSVKVSDLLKNLLSYITTNDNLNITTTEKELKELLENSEVNSYSPSNSDILKSIGALNYFGSGAWESIVTILSSGNYNIQKTIEELTKYNLDRDNLLKIIADA